jgi:uncharacterized membrane protein YedE/YeeE
MNNIQITLIALTIGLFITILTGVWKASVLAADVQTLKEEQDKVKSKIHKLSLEQI